jgi:hypothetical protein
MSLWSVVILIGTIAAGTIAGLLTNRFLFKTREKAHDFAREASAKSATEEPALEIKAEPSPLAAEMAESTIRPAEGPSTVTGPVHTKSIALIELETNLAIATSPLSEKLVSYQTKVWRTEQGEFNSLKSKDFGGLSEVYVDMLLANNIAWLVNELSGSNPNLITSYKQLSENIAQGLQQLIPTFRDSLNQENGTIDYPINRALCPTAVKDLPDHTF